MLQFESSPISLTFSGIRLDASRVAIMTEDMGPTVDYLLNQIFGSNLDDVVRHHSLVIARSSFSEYQRIFNKAFPGRDISIPETTIRQTVDSYVQAILRDDPDTLIVINDRYIAPHVEENFPDNIFRFSSTRVLQGKNTGQVKSVTMPRPGDPDFDTQLNFIEQKLNHNRKSLKGAKVILVDDVAVKHTTEDHLTKLFAGRGAIVDPKRNVFIYKVHFNEINPDLDRENSLLRLTNRVASTEQRELMPLPGGPIKGIGNNIAIQQPGQMPWGNGGILRTEGFLHRRMLDIEELELFIEVFGSIEEVLHGQIRLDGTEFEKFTFADIRYMIPSSAGFGPSNYIRKFRQLHGRPPAKLADLDVLGYIKLALEEIRRENKIYITHLVEDLDGTVIRMRYDDPLNKNFSTSCLGREIKSATLKLVEEYIAETGTNIEMNFENPAVMLTNNPPFAANLEKKYGQAARHHLKKHFIEFYGLQRGESEHNLFLQKYSFLPPGYHVLRELTWGRVDFDKVYEMDSTVARNFNLKIIDNDAHLIFLTAGPLIHAFRLLTEIRLADFVKSGKAVLLTVEDLYDPLTLMESGKGIIFDTLKTSCISNSRSDHFNSQNVLYRYEENPLALEKLGKIPKAHPHMILAIGDQPHSDIGPAIRMGGYGFIVDGPENLFEIFESAFVVGVERAIGMEAFLGNQDAIRRIREGK